VSAFTVTAKPIESLSNIGTNRHGRLRNRRSFTDSCIAVNPVRVTILDTGLAPLGWPLAEMAGSI